MADRTEGALFYLDMGIRCAENAHGGWAWDPPSFRPREWAGWREGQRIYRDRLEEAIALVAVARDELGKLPSLSLSQIDWLIGLVERWELGSSKRRMSSEVLATLRALRTEMTKEDDGAA